MVKRGTWDWFYGSDGVVEKTQMYGGRCFGLARGS